MKKEILFISFLFIFYALRAQEPDIQWQRSLGGTKTDYSNCFDQTTDGGYVVAGSSYSNDGDVSGHHGTQYKSDYWLAKLDSAGILQWQKSFGGPGSEYAHAVQQTSDGGYIIAGESQSNSGDVSGHHGEVLYSDAWIVKTDSIGNIEWQQSFGGSFTDNFYCISETSDTGYIACGSASSIDGDVIGNHGNVDYWIVKLAHDGSIQWQRCLGGSAGDYGYAAHQTMDGGYIAAGSAQSINGDISSHHGTESSSDFWIVKMDTLGNIEWEKSIGGTVSDYARDVEQTNDSGFIVSGISNSNDGDIFGHHGGAGFYDAWIVKLSNTGDLEWQNSMGGNFDDFGYSSSQTADGGFIAAGYTYSDDGDVTAHFGCFDIWIVKLGGGGIIEWQKSFGGSGCDEGISVEQTPDGYYVFEGYSGSTDMDVTVNHGSYDFWLVKLGPCIQQLFYADIDLDGYGDSAFDTLSCSIPPGYVADSSDCNDADANINPSATEIINGIDDNCNNLVDESSPIETVNEQQMVIFPDPVTNELHILSNGSDLVHFQLYDITGRLLESATITNKQFILQVSEYSPGIYTIVFDTDSGQMISKFIKN